MVSFRDLFATRNPYKLFRTPAHSHYTAPPRAPAHSIYENLFAQFHVLWAQRNGHIRTWYFPADSPSRENLPPPPPVGPDPRRLASDWARIVTAATLARTIATALTRVYFVGGQQVAIVRRRRGARPTVVEIPAPRLDGVRRPPHMIRWRVRTTLWFLFVITLITMSIGHGLTTVELSATSSLPTCIPIDEPAETPRGHATTSGAERNKRCSRRPELQSQPHERICITVRPHLHCSMPASLSVILPLP